MVVTIFIIDQLGRTSTVALDDTEFQGATVLDLKDKIEALATYLVSVRRMIFQGRELEDNFLLSHYGIHNAVTVHVILGFKGGGCPGGPGDPRLGGKDGKHSSKERLANF